MTSDRDASLRSPQPRLCHPSINNTSARTGLQSLVEVKVDVQVIVRESLGAQTVALALREGSDKQVVEKLRITH